ncbi:ABC-2 type transport system permease protein [Geodermatophilus saharensis]|uniref:ABC-2 type transport system permease protein n=1 Tax=Geodermatophilus saharensis TaxID=1137994 RepID=A0A239G8F7_9ACTN|nr:ABC transporter permease [Geodermatophilus saharensis]SNS64992.1 ABC-2 type transport system permease protein [Geodermatophilus saharensis]
MRHWCVSYGLLLRWQVIRLAAVLPVVLVVQAMMAVGIVVGFAFLVPALDPQTALYLSTGAPTVTLLTVGLVIVPQMVAQAKLEGRFDVERALPVPRLALLAADLTLWLLAVLPGVALGLLTAVLRFDVALRPGPLVVPAVLLVAVTATAVGYALAHLLRPVLAVLASQVLVFSVLLFSPVNFPAERLPDWLAAVHDVLPVQYMAQAVRESLTAPLGGVAWTPYAVLAAWCLAGLAVTGAAMARRR